MKKVSFIGLGAMGGPMAENLIRKGYEVSVLNRTRSKMDKYVAMGAYPLGNASEAPEKSDVIVLCLTNDDAMRLVVEEMLGADLQGKVIIDSTTARRSTTVELAAKVRDKGGFLLDSPVTGGVAGATAGTLTFMVGGDEDAFRSVLDVYEAMGSNIVYIGESGQGQLSKMVNQSLMNAIYCSVAENFAFAAENGIDLEKLYDAVENGGAKSNLLSGMRETILSGVPVENGNLTIMGKDCDYLTEECSKTRSFMPIQAAAQQVLNIGRKKGLEKYWTGCLYLIWEDLLGKKLNKEKGKKLL